MSVLIARSAFALSFAVCLLTIWTVCHVVHLFGERLFGLPTKRDRHGASVVVSQKSFRNLLFAPVARWIPLRGIDEMQAGFREAAAGGTPYVIANHNSMLDSLLITALIPPEIARNLRSMIKLALFAEPVFGGICSMVGHFPVYFKGSKAGDFGVDKEKQAKVAEEVDAFIGSNGGLVIFPEGQLNPNPRNLQPFRRGAFALPMKYSKPIYGFLNVGCEKVWPKGQPIGGWPGDISVRFFKVCEDASQFEDVTALADHAQRVMQTQLDDMYSRIEETGATKAD